MNERLTELYRSCRPKEALISQDEYKAANVLLGTEVEKFAELIIRECIKAYNDDGYQTEYEQDQKVLKHFGVEE